MGSVNSWPFMLAIGVIMSTCVAYPPNPDVATVTGLVEARGGDIWVAVDWMDPGSLPEKHLDGGAVRTGVVLTDRGTVAAYQMLPARGGIEGFPVPRDGLPAPKPLGQWLNLSEVRDDWRLSAVVVGAIPESEWPAVRDIIQQGIRDRGRPPVQAPDKDQAWLHIQIPDAGVAVEATQYGKQDSRLEKGLYNITYQMAELLWVANPTPPPPYLHLSVSDGDGPSESSVNGALSVAVDKMGWDLVVLQKMDYSSREEPGRAVGSGLVLEEPPGRHQYMLTAYAPSGAQDRASFTLSFDDTGNGSWRAGGLLPSTWAASCWAREDAAGGNRSFSVDIPIAWAPAPPQVVVEARAEGEVEAFLCAGAQELAAVGESFTNVTNANPHQRTLQLWLHATGPAVDASFEWRVHYGVPDGQSWMDHWQPQPPGTPK